MSTNDGMVLVNVVQFTLRDWFAGMALQGFLANPEWAPDADTLAKWCFARADAMLAAREKK